MNLKKNVSALKIIGFLYSNLRYYNRNPRFVIETFQMKSIHFIDLRHELDERETHLGMISNL